jgi:hypothetical protein
MAKTWKDLFPKRHQPRRREERRTLPPKLAYELEQEAA